ncbi:MAG: THUMP domain-containing protein [Thermoplasmatota archaeon]
MATSWDGVLVRFGEVGIKSAPVRRRMVETLRRNLVHRMVADGVEGDAKAAGARLWMLGPDPEALARCARRTFGVVSVSLARRATAELDAMAQAACDLAATAPPWQSFAVRASREGVHPFSSQDVGVFVGDRVSLAAQARGEPGRVDLGAPDLQIFVEVRGPGSYLYREKLPGPGGLPMGSQGEVVALLSDAPSAVAAWLTMRRGARVLPAHAGAAPVAAEVAALTRWGLPPMVPLPGGTKMDILAAAAHLARERGALAVVTGDGLSSSLLPAPGLALLRPVCGLPPGEVAAFRRRLMEA